MSSSVATAAEAEIWIVPFFGQGHLFPCIELCKQIASRNYKSTLIIPSHISATSIIPSSFHQYPLFEVTEIPSSSLPLPPPSPPHPHVVMHSQMLQGLRNLLSTREPESRPVCAVIDVMMGWTADVFKIFEVPIVGFFTSGACSAAVECAMWQARIQDVKPGEARLLPGLPVDMALFESDLKHRPHGPPPGGPPPLRGAPGSEKIGPPEAGDQPHWMKEVEGSMALMFNTCDGLEGPFINYLANQLGKPVWGVGPLLPEQFYKSAGSMLRDHEMRTNRRSSNMTEDEIIQWLNLKSRGSVLYVSFGTEVDPTLDEYLVLANALEASNRPFIWVIQGGAGRLDPLRHLDKPAEDSYFRSGLDNKVGKKGLIINGWAPQLLILSHQSTGGFLSHCGWNSTVEAIGCRVPILAWPIRGDQHYNAKFVINHLKVGYMISDDQSKSIQKDDIVSGIEKLMSDQEIKKRAHMLRSIFNHGFPLSSVVSLNAFIGLINQKSV
ncbi:glycosyltransferase [Citrus sinensis]|uniref:Glycosyltransferase n=1 Tax=Citrus sinensis TaxID=2711 RepID=A0ACB8HYA9_CITSI|nr:glycosyltransferase [Citrus sinensis]